MKDSKRRIEVFSLYDHSGVARHLERMSQKGWLLEKITPMVWRYRRVPPRQRRFAVTYCPKFTEYDPVQKQDPLYELCDYTGWKLAAASAQVQIFYNEQSSPIPLETEPALEVESLHRSVKKYLLGWGLVLVVALFGLLFSVHQLFQQPLALLGSGRDLFAALGSLVLTPLAAVELWGYFSWHAAAVQAAEQGVFLETRGHRGLHLAAAAVLLPALLWWVAAAPPREWVQPLLVPLVVLVALYLRQFLRERGTLPETNQAVFWGLLLCFALAASAIGSSGIWWQIQRTTVDRWLSQPPLATEDLSGQAEDWAIPDGSESPFLGYYTYGKVEFYHQGNPFFFDFGQLRYTLAAPKFSGLYPLCEELLLQPWEPARQWKYREESPPAPWGALRAYRLVETEQEPQGGQRYLLCYPHVLVDISFAWTPNAAQMALVGEKLGDIRL